MTCVTLLTPSASLPQYEIVAALLARSHDLTARRLSHIPQPYQFFAPARGHPSPETPVAEKKMPLQGNVVMQPSGLEGRIPVFVFPQSLTFYVGDHNTHKQILTLYNPYEFRIAFTVLSNNPICFDVEPANGVVYAKCSIDIVVTRSSLSLNDARQGDCMRVMIYEEGTKQILGKKDIPSTLQAGTPSPASRSDTGKFESVRGQLGASVGDTQDPKAGSTPQQQPFGHVYNGPSLILVSCAVVCLVGLLMPTLGEEEEATGVPPYMHLSSNIKIVLAYVLGLLTYAILKPM
ncbi:Motile sperm domain-containing protein 1 [Chionoecetes opilio]|uniref:Motile sperm domain-containing protein 1 n=1 Tax=Chionoecetes opilio TaxID=41210 RepID=A0A8J5CLS9_CHIOP|nr:Motile sperm domain-containing protein 1 [Chionoecetes opilio]